MKIVPYDSKYKKDFIEMNKAWIKEISDTTKAEHTQASISCKALNKRDARNACGNVSKNILNWNDVKSYRRQANNIPRR